MIDLEPFKRAVREAIESLGLKPVENYVTLAEDIDAFCVRAWVDFGRTFVKVYIDNEVAYVAAQPGSRDAVVALVRKEIESGTHHQVHE